MKYALSLLFLFITVVGICQKVVNGKVVKVADGDTITILTSDNTQVKVRLHGIDCPERKQAFGTKAREFTSNLVFARTVHVEVKDTDRYGRSIGIVKIQDGRVLNKELLKAGLAWHYKHYDKSKEFAQLEAEAKANRIGVWSLKNNVAPWEYRRSLRQTR